MLEKKLRTTKEKLKRKININEILEMIVFSLRMHLCRVNQ